jgi:hypothetical protein
MPKYEVYYYVKLMCLARVQGATKKEAKQKAEDDAFAKYGAAAHQVTIHQAVEVKEQKTQDG